VFIFKARFLQSDSTTTPMSKLFANRLEARCAISTPEEETATVPVMVVSPELFATMVPNADLNNAAVDATTEATSTPATKVKKSGRKRKIDGCDGTARKESS